jgi:hypothetical protein
MRKRPSPALIVACLALVFSMAGTGIAASHYLITSVRQIKPSVRHQLRGQRGPRGLRGPAGRPGASGRAVKASTSSVGRVQSTAVNVPASGDVTQHADCPQSTEAVGGGFSAPGAIVTESQQFQTSWPTVTWPASPVSGWTVTAHREPGAPQATLTVSVVCLNS